jgi:predicted Zn-dependent protease
MLNRFLLVCVPLLACVQASVVRAETENTPEYRERLAAEKKYPEALRAYKDALTKDPKNPVLLYNAGLMAYLAEKPKEAIEFWSKGRKIEPDNWHLRPKLIQAYEAAGDRKKRDAERAELYKLRKNAKNEELKNLESVASLLGVMQPFAWRGRYAG